MVEDIWDSIALDESVVPIPRSHRDELDRRLRIHESAPGNLLTLEELQARIEKGNDAQHSVSSRSRRRYYPWVCMVRSEVAKSWRGIPTDVLCLR